MRETGTDQYRCLVLSRRWLAGMKEELMLEIQRQRGANFRRHEDARAAARPRLAAHPGPAPAALPELKRWSVRALPRRPAHRQSTFSASALLRAATRRYRRRLQRQVEEERRRAREMSR